MADTLNFKKGVASALPAVSNGQILFTTDTNELYIDDAGSHKQINANNAKSADKLNTNAGDSNTPIYFSNGKPVVCTGLDLNTSGNAATATNVAWSGVTGKPSTYPPEDHTHSYLPLSGGTVTGTLTVDNGNSSGSVSISEDSEGGTIRLYGKNGTYCYEMDSYNDEELRIHTAQKHPSDIDYKSIKWSGKTGALTADSFNGNATSASKLETARTISLTGSITGSGSFDGSGNLSIATTTNHSHSYLPLSGGTMTGKITRSDQAGTLAQGWEGCLLSAENISAYTGIYCGNGDAPANALGTSGIANLFIKSWYGVGFVDGCSGKGMTVGIDCRSGTIYSNKTYGAVWNDYAEFRVCNEDFKPGQVVLENGDDTLSIAGERLQRGCSIVSDTFGFAIGETDEAKCPIAVSGRVLAYGHESREEFKKHIGWPVCSGPNGTVSIMTEEEEEKYPSRIIGTVSAVPDYETWGADNIEVNNRIWIKIK